MAPNRKSWNQQQKALRQALTRSDDHHQAVELFLSQHAMVHSAAMSQSRLETFVDQVWQDLTDEAARRIPRNCEHSVAWVFWHIARIEDVTMNLLVAGSPQLFSQENWPKRLNVTLHHTGNVMDAAAVAEFSAAIDIQALRAYRLAVGRRTREIVRAIVQGVLPEDIHKRVDPARLQRVWDEGAVVEAAREIVDYWSKRTIAGLLLMPPTRHNFIHVNEALRLKQRRR